MKSDIASIRKDYTKEILDESHVDTDPMVQFDKWFAEAVKAEVPEPNAMTLSTVSASGFPSGRILLLKGITREGFTFYTNYQSSKGRDLAQSGVGALTFFWAELERQVRVQGHVSKVSKEVSEAYFHSRPRGSQIGAWVSPQSSIIKNRQLLEERQQSLEEKFRDESKIPLPKQWGGYLLEPFLVEFWQGRPSRLHDRIIYTQEQGSWKIQRLAP
jgi:pyridoxamine 5'-phosphate oxidase